MHVPIFDENYVFSCLRKEREMGMLQASLLVIKFLCNVDYDNNKIHSRSNIYLEQGHETF